MNTCTAYGRYEACCDRAISNCTLHVKRSTRSTIYRLAVERFQFIFINGAQNICTTYKGRGDKELIKGNLHVDPSILSPTSRFTVEKFSKKFRCSTVQTRSHYGTGVDSASNRNQYQEYVEIKCQLDATEVFIADLIACSTCFGHHYAHHQEISTY